MANVRCTGAATIVECSCATATSAPEPRRGSCANSLLYIGGKPNTKEVFDTQTARGMKRHEKQNTYDLPALYAMYAFNRNSSIPLPQPVPVRALS